MATIDDAALPATTLANKFGTGPDASWGGSPFSASTDFPEPATPHAAPSPVAGADNTEGGDEGQQQDPGGSDGSILAALPSSLTGTTSAPWSSPFADKATATTSTRADDSGLNPGTSSVTLSDVVRPPQEAAAPPPPIDFLHAFTDPQGWMLSLSQPKQEALRYNFSFKDDPEAARRRFLLAGYFTHLTGRSMADISSALEPFYLPAFALSPDGQQIGLGHAGASVDQTFTALGKKFQRDRAALDLAQAKPPVPVADTVSPSPTPSDPAAGLATAVDRLTADPAFTGLPPDQRSQVLKREIHRAATAMRGPWSQASWQQFDQQAAAAREKIAALGSLNEARKRYFEFGDPGDNGRLLSGSVPDAAYGFLKSIVGGVADLSFVNPQAGQPFLRMPGQNLAASANSLLEKTTDSVQGWGSRVLGDRQPFDDAFGRFASDLKSGNFPLNDKPAFDAWMEQNAEAVSQAQAHWYDAAQGPGWDHRYAESNGLFAGPNRDLILDYIHSRDPAALAQLREALLITPQRAAMESAENNRLKRDNVTRWLTATTGTDFTDAMRDAPLNLLSIIPLGEVFQAAKGVEAAKAAEAGIKAATTTGSKIATLAEGAASNLAIGSAQYAIDHPNATWEEYKQASKDMIANSIGLTAAAHVAGAGWKALRDTAREVNERIRGAEPAAKPPAADPSAAGATAEPASQADATHIPPDDNPFDHPRDDASAARNGMNGADDNGKAGTVNDDTLYDKSSNDDGNSGSAPADTIPTTDKKIIEETPGEKGNWNSALNQFPLEKNVIYKVGDFIYETNGDGLVIRTAFPVELVSSDRNVYQQQKSVRLKDGIVGHDDGGHTIARQFKGPGEQINYNPLEKVSNRWDDWKQMENLWEGEKRQNPDSNVYVEIFTTYPKGSKRPSQFTAHTTITRRDGSVETHTHNITNHRLP